MPDPQMIVRIVANTAELKKALAEGTSQITTTTAAMGKLAASLDGSKLIQNAHNIVASINQIGGAAKLTDGEAARLRSTLEKAIEKARAMGKDVPRDMLQMAESLKRVSKEVEELPRQLTLADKAAGFLKSTFAQFTAANLAATAIQGAVGALQGFVAQGAKLPALESSFRTLAAGLKQNSTEMLATLQSSTRGLVSNYDLMTSANKAMMLGLPVTTESMGDLAKAATTLGRAMGQDATKSLDDLITALGRSSPQILDNLGLTVKVSEANEAYAAKLGKTVDQLTDAEEKTAFYEEAMRKAREKTAQLGEQTKTLGEITETVWTKIGNSVTTSAGVINTGVGRAMSSFKAFGQFLQDWQRSGFMIAAAGQAALEAARTAPRRPDILLPSGDAEAKSLDDLRRAAQELSTKALAPLTRLQRELALEFLKGGESAAQIAERLNGVKATAGVTAKQIDALADAHRRGQSEARKHAKELEKFAKEIGSLGPAIVTGITGTLPGRPFSLSMLGLDRVLPNLPQIANRLGLSSLPGFQSEKPNVKAVKPRTLFDSMFGSSAELGNMLASTITAAIQGGGDAIRSAGSALGSNIMGGLAKHLTTAKDGAAAALSGWLGGAANAVLPMVGTLLGPLLNQVGKFLDSVFDRNKGRDMVEAFAESFGGFDALHRKLATLGAEGERLWVRLTQGVGRNNPEQAKAAIEAINNAFGAQEDKLARAEAAIEKYGFTWEELGSKVQNARLSELAQDLAKDWEALIFVGVDLEAAATRMSGAVQDYISKAAIAGAEVPAAMRPIIEKMIELGLLTDKDGNKIESLETSGIKFTETLTQGFDRVVGKLDELIDRLDNGLGGALDRVGKRRVSIPVGLDYPASVPAGMPVHPQAHGGDYWVTRPTLFMAGEAGLERATFTPAGSGSGGRGGVLILELNGQRLAQMLMPDIAGEARRLRLV